MKHSSVGHIAPNPQQGPPDRRVAFQVRLPVSLVLALDAKADAKGETVAAVLEQLVRAGLSTHARRQAGP